MLNKIESAVSSFGKYIGLTMLCAVAFLAFYSATVSAEKVSFAATAPTPKATAKQTGKTAAKTAPTPKRSTSSTAKTTATPKPAPRTNSDAGKVIVSVTAARVRSEASTSSAELTKLKLGTVVPTTQKTSGAAPWYKVQLASSSKVTGGWMSSTVVSPFDPAKAEMIYRQLALRYPVKTTTSFSDAVEIYEFLTRIQPELKTSESISSLGLKRLQALAATLRKIPIEKAEEAQYKNFTAGQDKNIVYSEPAGQFFVRADLYWDLHKKYKGTVIGEEIAWAGARTDLPGECEGYIVCDLYNIREMDGTYLENYPDGKHAAESLKNIISYLEPIVADTKDKAVYNGPTDLSDRAEFNRLLSELRNIISKMPHPDKEKALQQIAKLAEAYR
jgi:hypothetical protein